MPRKEYPYWTEFAEVLYGVGAPLVGCGVYTLDLKFSWPDRKATTKKEYLAWAANLRKRGYKIPKHYKNSYVGYKGRKG